MSPVARDPRGVLPDRERGHPSIPGGGSGRHLFAAIVLMGALVALPSCAAQQEWALGEPVRVAEGVKDPVDIAFGRDGYLYYASLTPREVRRVEVATGALDEGFVVALPAATWAPRSETGVFGLALHPGFASNGVLYVSYSSNGTGTWTNVLSRLTLQDEGGAATEEVLFVRPGNTFHNGGRVLVADGHLWWTTGDASHFEEDPMVAGMVAQKDGDLRGKVLRLTLDGQVPADNPWGDAAFTKGHRNVYGIAWDPDEERMLVTENGNARRDYLYVLERGANYGWPHCEGACDEPRPEYEEPIWQSNGTVAPTGVAWFRGAFWFGTFNQGDLLRASDATGDWVVEKVHHYGGTDKVGPRVLDVEVGPDGESLWFSAWSEIWRIGFPPDGRFPGMDPLAGEPFWWAGGAAGEGTGALGEGSGDRGIPGPVGIVAVVAAGGLLLLRRRR